MSASSLALLLLVACSTPAAAPDFNYDLRCTASNTETESKLFCLRIDTRTGEVVRVDYGALAVSNGPTAAPPARAGTYALSCDATSTKTRSDLYCLRLNRDTGEMLLLGLPALPHIPATVPAATR
jgi:hypothetical protein